MPTNDQVAQIIIYVEIENKLDTVSQAGIYVEIEEESGEEKYGPRLQVI